MNAGFLEALKEGDWKCFIFHDVDLLPQNKLSFYKCRSRPTHFSAAIDKYNYTVPYHGIFGGAIAMFKEFFKEINGFSNEFWGWGGEDDNMRERVLATGTKFHRLPDNAGRYKMLRHPPDIGNPENP
uniref:Beta-1,4-galactosyltransferase n=1 Tax=Panagrolaimus sp. PS1159 TaxID=55785 RepID=A0AC35GH31_9BILA